MGRIGKFIAAVSLVFASLGSGLLVEEAGAATCPLTDDCKYPPSACNGASTIHTTTSGLGNWVELRYRGGSCRHVWARTYWPSSSTHPIWATRQVGPAGNTLGYGYRISGSVRWSTQMEDAGYKSRVCVDTGAPSSCTPSY